MNELLAFLVGRSSQRSRLEERVEQLEREIVFLRSYLKLPVDDIPMSDLERQSLQARMDRRNEPSSIPWPKE